MNTRRTAAWARCVFCLLSLGVFFPARAAGRPDVPANWQAKAQRQIAEAEYAVTWQPQPLVPTLAPSWQSPNRAQGFRTYFTDSGPRVFPRTEEVPSWQWGLRLLAVGRGETRLALEEPAPLVPQANRISYRRGSVEEWYVNDARGLKQGFTLSHRPDGDKDPVRLNFLLEGNLSPRISADGQSIDFVTPEGARALRYAELLVTDATGRDLPAHMEGWSADGQRGIRLVVADKHAVWPLTIDPLLTSPSWTAEIDQANAVFGFTVGAAGDVNGDGYGDVIVGAPQFDNGETDEGRVFVYHGSPSGLSLTPNWTEESDQAGAIFARAVGTAGDVNGDGYSDVIVSAPVYDNGQTDEGRAYVYYGSASGLPATESWTAESDQANAQFSWSLGTAGDVNGDGYSDVIVGSQLFDNGETNEGRTFVYHGSASGLSATANWTAESNQAAAGFGQSVGTAGDVNGDGYADVIVAASLFDSGESNEGRAFVFHGSVFGLSVTANWTAESNQTSAEFGISCGTAGDVNGDGYADVIVGAYGYDGPEANEGRAYVFHGSSTGLSPTVTWTAESDQANAQFGSIVGTAGDVNGDGYADVVVGAVTYDNGETDEGRGSVYYGSPTGLPSAPNWTAEGNQASVFFAGGFATAGDVNGDGYADVIVGAPNYDNEQTDEGRAFVYLGAPAGLALAASWMSDADQLGAGFGAAAGAAGDVNGDGYGDVIVGAPGFDGGQADEGRVFVFHGSLSGLSPTASWTAESDQAGALFGSAVGTAGDVNGDGYADVIVRATQLGLAFVYHGSVSGLAPAASWTGGGGEAGNGARAVSSAGDVNGDGYADVILGRVSTLAFPHQLIIAAVYHGSASGLSNVESWGKFVGQGYQVGYGVAVGNAGDVNGDGYADVIVAGALTNGALDKGRIDIFHGSASGLSSQAGWTVEKPSLSGYTSFGRAVGTAGDVNGDGYADVIVGEPSRESAFVYLGSGTGMSGTESWEESIQFGSQFGCSVGAAGDVNGDGYADVIVGASSFDNGQTDEGRAFVFHGSASGLSLTAAWTAESDQASAGFGVSASAAGDVNGDGYADVIVGAPNFDNPDVDEGRAFVYLGGGGAGASLRPQQRRADDAAPIAPMGSSGSIDTARLGALGRTPFGRGRVKLEWELKLLGMPFDGTGLQASAGWLDTGTGAVVLNEVLAGLADDSVYHWRLRLHYHPGTTPFQARGRWFTGAGNGWQEGDFRTDAIPPIPVVADLSVSQVASLDTLFVGAEVTYTVSVFNAGPDPATVLLYDNPETGSVVSALPSQGSCVGGGFVECNLGVLASGSGATLLLTVTHQSAGLLRNHAFLSVDGGLSPWIDSNLSNNESMETTSVIPVKIGDRAWEDMNGDGVQDAGEPGVADVLVLLYDGAGTFLNFMLTGASGAYEFSDVSLGATYRLRFVPPSSHVLTAKDQGGNDLLDSDVDQVTQLTPAFALVNTQEPVRWDAGLIPSCAAPDERIFLYTVTQSTDGNHYPILHFQDPNQLVQVTGYNVYRSSNPALPPASWPLVASNVIDMDQGTPNKQWVDSSGASGTWYYQVTAYNSRCPAEGPR